MKSSARDKIEGVMHQAKGKLKAGAGHLAGNPDLKLEGKAEEAMGKLQAKRGDVKNVAGH